MIEAKQVQQRGVQVMDVDLILLRPETELVGRSVDVAALCAAAGQPHGEAVRIVVATVLAGIRTEGAQLHNRRAPELAAPDHEGVVQHTALLEVGEQSGDRLIALPRQLAVVRLDLGMGIPRLPCPVPDLDEPNALLEQSARDQHLPPVQRVAVQFAGGRGFLADIEDIRRLHLHAESEFEGLRPRF